MFPRRSIKWVLVCLALRAAVPAWAAPGREQQVDALIVEANRLRNMGDDQSALPLLVRAYQVDPGPRTVVHLGMVESALGRWADADRHLTEGLKTPNHPFIAKNVDKIVERLKLGKEKIGTVEVKGEPEGAEVLVNGSPAGTLPLSSPVAVNAGPADVEVRAPAHESQTRSLTIAPKTLHTVVLRLRPLSGGQAAGPAPPATSAPPAYGEPGLGVGAVAEPEPRRHGAWWWLRLGTFTAAAGAAAVAGYGYYVHEHKVNEFRQKLDPSRRQRCLERGSTVVDIDGKMAMRDCFDLRAQYRNAQTVMIGGLVAAGVLATAAISLWVFAPDGHPERAGRADAQQLAIVVAPGSAWAGWKLSF